MRQPVVIPGFTRRAPDTALTETSAPGALTYRQMFPRSAKVRVYGSGLQKMYIYILFLRRNFASLARSAFLDPHREFLPGQV